MKKLVFILFVLFGLALKAQDIPDSPVQPLYGVRHFVSMDGNDTLSLSYEDGMINWRSTDSVLIHRLFFDDVFSGQYGDTISYSFPYVDTISIGSGTVRLYDNEFFINVPREFVLPAKNIHLPSDEVTYIYASYNGGDPEYFGTSTQTDINESNTIPIYTVYRQNGNKYVQGWYQLGQGLSNKLHKHHIFTNRFDRESGLTIDTLNDLNVQLSAGVIWQGAERESLNYFSSLANSLYFYWYDGADWNYTDTTVLNNTNYNTSAGLQNTSNNNYVVNWFFRGYGTGAVMFFIVGDENYKKLGDALNAQIPSNLPSIIKKFSFPVGKIIIKKDGTEVDEIISYFEKAYSTSPIVQHNNLGGIQGGAAGEYYHLTSDEVTKLSGIEEGAEVNVNADWNAGSGDAEILNKPDVMEFADTVSIIATKYDMDTLNTGGGGGTGVTIGSESQIPFSNSAGDDFDYSADFTWNGNTLTLEADSGVWNTFVGDLSGNSATTGQRNSFFGYASGRYNTSGNQNTFIGYQSGTSTTTGDYNTFIGSLSGLNNTEGESNMFLGSYAGYQNTTGDNNIFIGHKAGYYETSSNKLYIESSEADLPLIYGNFLDDTLRFNTVADGALLAAQPTGGEDLAIATTKYVDDNAGGSSVWDSDANGIYYNNGTSTVMRVENDGQLKLQTEQWHSDIDGIWRFRYISSGNTQFQTASGYDFRNSSGTDMMVIQSDGDVGIGTSTPEYSLHISGNGIFVEGDGIRLESNSGNNRYGLKYGSAGNVDDSDDLMLTNREGGGSLLFGTSGAAGGGVNEETRMTIDSDGNVGIGTTNPSRLLHLYEGSSGESTAFSSDSDISIEASGSSYIEWKVPQSSYSGLLFSDNTSIAGGLVYGHNNSSYSNILGIAAWDKISFRVSSISGIYTKTERAYINSSGNMWVDGDVTADDFNLSSDRRLKTAINPIESGLFKSTRLNPVQFRYKEDGRKGIGFIAQEVQRVFPELVTEWEDGYLRLSYMQITAINNAAIHELNDKVKELEKENTKLKTKIRRMEKWLKENTGY